MLRQNRGEFEQEKRRFKQNENEGNERENNRLLLFLIERNNKSSRKPTHNLGSLKPWSYPDLLTTTKILALVLTGTRHTTFYAGVDQRPFDAPRVYADHLSENRRIRYEPYPLLVPALAS